MFETSVIESPRRKRSSRRLVLFPLSLALHALLITGMIFAAVWSVDLPDSPPRQMTTYSEVALPPPPPPMIARRAEPATSSAARPSVPTPELAPLEIEQPSNDANQSGEQTGLPDGDPNGSAAGDPNGSPAGVDGGVPSELAPESFLTPRPVTGEVVAPEIMHRVAPIYPPLAVRMQLRGFVRVECVVDREGMIRNIRIVASSHEMLNASVVKAVAQWRFRPGTLRGVPIDTIFQLNVNFDLH